MYGPIGFGVVEMAKQFRNGAEAVNCVKIQRSASWSWRTTGSPAFCAWQAPPKPDHSVLLAIGPARSVPVLL